MDTSMNSYRLFTSFLFIISWFLVGCSEKKADTGQKSAPEVTIITVEKKNSPATFDFIAQTQSSRMVKIQSRVSGFLDRRVYTEGEIVKEGQILFLMDKKPFQAQVIAAQAALERQEAAKETSRLNLERVRPLTKLNALSQKDLDDAIGSFESTLAAVEQAKAQLITAKLNLSYCTIRSPLEGVSSAALQQDGSYINISNSELTTVSALDPMWVNFSLSENQLQNFLDQIANGELIPPKDDEYVVDVILVNGDIFPYQGKITFTQPFYNQETGTFLIRSTVKNPDAVLRPNQYVHVKVHGAIHPDVITVPQKAVQQSSKGHFVWVVDSDGKAVVRPVAVGEWQGKQWIIKSGLSNGDKVIVEGFLGLQTGEQVTIKES